jgi:hypothetical protein
MPSSFRLACFFARSPSYVERRLTRSQKDVMNGFPDLTAILATQPRYDYNDYDDLFN